MSDFADLDVALRGCSELGLRRPGRLVMHQSSQWHDAGFPDVGTLWYAFANGRTVAGIAVSFNAPTEIHELGTRYREQFVRGAFARTIAERGPER